MKKDYNVRSYQLGDEEEIVQLLQLVFDGWPHIDLKCNPFEYWRWKHKENPLKKGIIAVCVSDNRIIGCSHRIPLKIKIGQEDCLGYSAVDLAVHPDFRRRGISRKLIEFITNLEMKEGVRLVYFITGNPIMIKSYTGIYPLFPHSLVNLVRIKDIDIHLKAIPIESSWLIKLVFRVTKLINNFRSAVSPSEALDQDLSISRIQYFDEKVDRFFRETIPHLFLVSLKR